MEGTMGMGWLPDYPDIRDYGVEQKTIQPKLVTMGQKDSIKNMLNKLGIIAPKKTTLQSKVDLRPYFSPIENQGGLGSCTANAGVGVVEYFEKRAFGTYTHASRLFLYKVTRNLLDWTGDTGAFLRTTMGALVLFGIPPEKYCNYIIDNYDIEPTAFLYSFAQNYQAIQYYRLDTLGLSTAVLLDRIKLFLTAGLPSMFGFTVYDSINQVDKTGKIPYPAPGEKVRGGHAIVAAGYDDSVTIENTSPQAKKTKGALLIRNSWGAEWGDEGYGWLPYEYVLSGLAIDWWSLLKNEWVNTKQFGLST